jgi:hypothetical protein
LSGKDGVVRYDKRKLLVTYLNWLIKCTVKLIILGLFVNLHFKHTY